MSQHIIIDGKRYTLDEYIAKSKKERAEIAEQIKEVERKIKGTGFVPFEESK